MRNRGGRVLRLAVPIKALAQRFAFLLLLAASAGLIVLSKADLGLTERVRTQAIDAIAPVLEAIAEPVAAVQGIADAADRMMFHYRDNARLREENARLMQWQQAARQLEQENAELRRLLAAGVDPALAWVTARVIGDSGGPFVRTVLLNSGADQGVRKGYPAMTELGVIGRVAEAGRRAARVLLLSDLNSRIPVALEEGRHRGILAGDNSDLPRLEYLPHGAQPQVGDRVVTSGDGGMYPAGLPVGVVVAIGEGGIRVQPHADLRRLDFVRLLQYEPPRLAEGEAARAAGRR